MDQQPIPTKRAVLYLRARCVDHSDDGVDASLARQRAVCTRIAQVHGATVLRDYEAIGGARDGHVRYIVSVMLGQVADGHVDYIITSGFDRLFRGPAKADRKLLRAIRDTGATLLCGSTWDIAVPTGPSDDVLADTYQAMTAGGMS
jgi:DNA invertase Pin-like site-specific DNA recombinase